MGLDGIAGRQLLARLGGVTRQERKRAADNDNRLPELPRREGLRAEDTGSEGAAETRSALHQRGKPARDTGRPVGQWE